MSFMRRIMIVAALTAACAAGAVADTALPPVRVDAGLIAGTTRDGINRFFGIPFAAPPVGDLRWRAPQPVKPWDGVKDASAFGPVCRQTVDWIKAPQSEDCLSLNIWAPAKPGKYPVMVWIHGGGFFGGTGSQDGPDAGNGLVAHDVILVTINYRLGVFGFFAHPELSAESPDHSSGNQAVLDQIAALKWVKANIAAFGGDPDRVTIVGESAGGSSVVLLTVSPAAKGLFHRAISESGGIGPLPPLNDAEKRGAAVAGEQKAAHIADLRKADAGALMKRKWNPMPNIDASTLPLGAAASYAAGRANPVPIITGWNSDEGQDLAPEGLGGKPITAAKYQAAMTMMFGPQASAIMQAYPGHSDAEAEASAYRLSTDMMGVSVYGWATLQVTAKTTPVYVYYFVHWPAEPATPCGYGCKAGHGAEIRFAFDRLALDPRVWTSDDKRIADQMARYWTNFAKTGNPNGDGLPQWPSFDGAPSSVTVIGTEPEIKARGSFPDFRPWLAYMPK